MRAIRGGRRFQRVAPSVRCSDDASAARTCACGTLRSFAFTFGASTSIGSPTGSRFRLASARTIVAAAACRSRTWPVLLGTIRG